MRERWLASILALGLLGALPGRAQTGSWTPPGLAALAAHASFQTDFTFDRGMLDAAGPMLPEQDRPIVAQLRSITIHDFRYGAPGMIDPSTLEAVRAQYRAQGWSHLVTKQMHPEADAAPEPADSTRTDLWVHMAHGKFDHLALLVASDRNVSLVVVDGTISPLDLLHLRGHFGIPRFGGDDFVESK